MNWQEPKVGMRVQVAYLISDLRGLGLPECSISNRRAGKNGVIMPDPTGHNTLYFVRHDDQTGIQWGDGSDTAVAVYHVHELNPLPAEETAPGFNTAGSGTGSAQSSGFSWRRRLDQMKQYLGVVPPAPDRSEQKYGITINHYTHVPEVLLEADAIVATVKTKGKWVERIGTPINTFIRIEFGDYYHDQLRKLGDLEHLETAFIASDPKAPTPPFTNVVFVSGTRPMAEVVARALQTAQEYGCKSLTLSLLALTGTPDAPRRLVEETLTEIDLALSTADLTGFTTINLIT